MSSQPPGSTPWNLPPGHPLAPGQLGPIHMGYQLAKDPITGQILLIPTDTASTPGHSSL